jgi:uncharacterized protein (DUF2252 family)
MGDILRSTGRREDWLRRRLGAELVEKDLARKHKRMRGDTFSFLRATYWRWAETVLDVCADAAGAPSVLAVGDIHLENFGTWRDADGRLAWGVNDFDEAAQMPYVLDLVRLATSAVLAAELSGRTPRDLCKAILKGYRRGLSAPQALILDRDQAWLRERLVVSEKRRARFWDKIDAARPEAMPARYRRAVAAAMPEARLAFRSARRTAGCGSLGLPRWIGVAQWRGAPVVREAKALLPSAWELAHGGGGGINYGAIANGSYRAVDPWLRVDGSILVRRLSPNNRKIEAGDDLATLLATPMLEAMGLDLASVHLGTGAHGPAIRKDLAERGLGWLAAAAARMAETVAHDHKRWQAARKG